MKKGLLFVSALLIIVFSSVPAVALSASDEPWNSDNNSNIIGVEFLIESNGSATVSWTEEYADYYDVFLVKSGSDNKYSPVKGAKRINSTDPKEAIFDSSYFYDCTDKPDEYKFCVISSKEDDGEYTYGYGESFEFNYSDFAPAGVLTVNVTSFLSDSDPVTVTVSETQMPDASFTETVYGNKASCVFDAVNDDELTVTIKKKNHIDRTYTLTKSGDITLNAKIHPLGDINGDGKITTTDYAQVNAAAKGARPLTDEYLKKVADINSDGKITTIDAAMVNAAAKGAKPLW